MDASLELEIIRKLERIDERTARFDKAIFGNGQPGLLDRVAKNEERVDQVRSDLELFTVSTVNEATKKSAGRATTAASALALLMTVATIIAALLGVPLPAA